MLRRYTTRGLRQLNAEKILENVARWVSSFSEDTSKNICALYNEQATLWGTLSPIKRDSATLIKDYFDQVFKYSNRYAELTEANVRLFGDIAICNGLYNFSWLNDGVQVTTAARFSLVYINQGGRWLITEHHSSCIPQLA